MKSIPCSTSQSIATFDKRYGTEDNLSHLSLNRRRMNADIKKASIKKLIFRWSQNCIWFYKLVKITVLGSICAEDLYKGKKQEKLIGRRKQKNCPDAGFLA
ncbi:MAG TPA: hypothetical protein PLC35_07785 [Methanosarcina vacuolata]|nr:hypothetical protein [Methanosarcina vacuolata]